MQIRTALILCAGFGKRLNPLTEKIPKPLLELNNVTLLENCINLVIKLGIKKIFLNTFHLSDQIISFIKKKNFQIEIQIVEDGKEILDTGGGILNMMKKFLLLLNRLMQCLVKVLQACLTLVKHLVPLKVFVRL